MMFYAFVLVTIGIFAIDPFAGVDADGKIKNYFSSINQTFRFKVDFIKIIHLICIFVLLFILLVAHDSSKCLEDNGNGLQPDSDCRDCSKPPKQACADGYIMTSTTLSNGCTEITCEFPGTLSAILFNFTLMISARNEMINMIIESVY